MELRKLTHEGFLPREKNDMTILFSREFGIKTIDIRRSGVFDALLDADSHFFINIKRLQWQDF